MKTTAPMMSLDASGSFAGTMVASRWKGRKYMRLLVKPSNPRTGPQTGVRALMRFLSQQWSSLDPGDQATWSGLAVQGNFSNINAYQRFNAKNFTQYLWPSQAYPADRVVTNATISSITGTPGVGQASISVVSNTIVGQWGVAVHRSITPSFTPTRDNLIGIAFADSTTVLWIDTGLTPGTYYYNAHNFTVDGNLGANGTEETVVVT